MDCSQIDDAWDDYREERYTMYRLRRSLNKPGALPPELIDIIAEYEPKLRPGMIDKLTFTLQQIDPVFDDDVPDCNSLKQLLVSACVPC